MLLLTYKQIYSVWPFATPSAIIVNTVYIILVV